MRRAHHVVCSLALYRARSKSLEMPLYAVQDRFEAKQFYGPIPLAKEELDIGFVAKVHARLMGKLSLFNGFILYYPG